MAEGISKVLKGGWDSFVSKEHAIAEFTNQHNGRDKFIKFVIAVFDIINAGLALSKNTHPHTIEGMKLTGEALKLTRAVTGCLNAWGDGPGNIKDSVRRIYLLCLDLLDSNRDIEIEERIERAGLGIRGQDGYKSKFQKELGIVTELLKVIATIAFLGGFGLCRPIQVIGGKFFKNINESAKQIGNQFGKFMMANHIAASGASFANMVREGKYYYDFTHSDKANDLEIAEKKLLKLFKAMRDDILKLLENGCDLGLDVIGIFEYTVPAGITLTLALIIGTVGLYNAWEKACIAAEDKGKAAKLRREATVEKYTKKYDDFVSGGIKVAVSGFGVELPKTELNTSH